MRVYYFAVMILLNSIFISVAMAEECPDIPVSLENCQPYSCNFTHPFTKETLEKKIVGFEGDKCLYIEQMPNGGKMECRYSEQQRKEVAEGYRGYMSGKDPMSIQNTMQKYVNDGTCRVSGY